MPGREGRGGKRETEGSVLSTGGMGALEKECKSWGDPSGAKKVNSAYCG